MLAQKRTSQYAKSTLAKSNVGLGSLFLHEARPLLKRSYCACMLRLAFYGKAYRDTFTCAGSCNQSANLVRLATSCLAALTVSFQLSYTESLT